MKGSADEPVGVDNRGVNLRRKALTSDEPVVLLTREHLIRWWAGGDVTDLENEESSDSAVPGGDDGEESGESVGAWGRRLRTPGSSPATVMTWCGNCGADLEFDVTVALMRCPLCGWKIPR